MAKADAAIKTAMKGQAAAKAAKAGTKRVSIATGKASTNGTRPATASKAPAKASTTVAKPVAAKAPTTKVATTKKLGVSQADKVRAYIDKHPDARDSEVAKATDVAPAYVWDIRAAMRKKAEAAKAQSKKTTASVAKSAKK